MRQNAYSVLVKKHPKLEKKLPRLLKLKKDQEDAEKIMFHYLVELRETVEMLLPDHEGAISEKVQIVKNIVEDESLLMLAIDPNARFGWKSQTRSFDTEKCKTCPLRDGYFKAGAKSKTYSIRIVVEHYEEQIEFGNSHRFKERIRHRPIIEHKNGELKRYHGMTKAKYRGLFRMRIQAILTAFIVNAKRMVKLIKQMQPVS